MPHTPTRGPAAGVLAMLLLAALAAGPAGAEEAGEGGLQVKVGSDGFEFELEEERAGQETETKVAFKAAEAAIEAEVERENATEEVEYEIEVRLRQLIEYRDAGGDGVYREGADEAVQRVALRGLRWTFTGPSPANIGGVAVQQVAAQAALPGNGSLTLVFAAGEDTFRAGVSEVTPQAVKFDIRIEDFPWRAQDTRLALAAEVVEELESEVRVDRDDRGEDSVQSRTAAFVGAFRWAANATVDGADQPVRSTVGELPRGDRDEDDEDEKASLVTLNYPRGLSIVHDPVLGVSMASRGLPFPAAGAVVAAVAAAALVLGRRRA